MPTPLDTPAAPPDPTFPAGGSQRRIPARAARGSKLHRRGGLTAWPMALVRRRTWRCRRNDEEATTFARRIELHQVAVFVVARELLAGEEKGVGTISGNREQAGVERALSRRNQLNIPRAPLI